MLQIDKREAEYLRAHGAYVSMTNRGKHYYLTESLKNMKLHRRYHESKKATE